MCFPSAKNYAAALSHAGYFVDWDDNYFAIVETSTCFLYVLQDMGGSYSVGRFNKATISSAGDFTGVPYYEGDSLAVALAILAAEAIKAGK